ncbi:1-acyl-sn-glycerol-3-phosphate acyltransferase [bacterium BMS3Abin07]|nr:1-acyl-sn-glycerol-3-phosphate acyltransferase [bacterium BMS3Abin07]GBE33237.1 1-acyl-sn-glycerol-3-phosphate acyltransferase [bacterium BMS3Bbin05]HDO21690.1 1-acyl-sn-glycerol-3-phosphate acyltransferase [Nitrospirota bacterium]HDZ87182.1 1-acyl-sn-glycerol-3-phosphate acyltransferase [Nitrospirota bacterium]
MKTLYPFFKFILLVLYKLFLRFEVSGKGNIPEKGGVIIASNHLSYLDPPLVGISIKRRATYMAKSGLFGIPLIGKFVESFSFPVDRKNPKPSTIKDAVRRLKNGELIVMFPEGTRSPAGDSTSGKRGVAIIAAMSKAVIIPAHIEGTERALPVGAKFIRPAKVRITFGKALAIKPGESEKEFQVRITRDLLSIIKNLK